MTISTIILAAAKAVGVPGALLLAICTHESNLENVIVADDGGSPSIGVCQMKQATAESMGFVGTQTDLLKPKTNAKYAAKYLKKQLDRYDGDWCKATAAYNSGTYNPSKKAPGKPRNLKYIKSVVLKLDDKHKDYLICGERKAE